MSLAPAANIQKAAAGKQAGTDEPMGSTPTVDERHKKRSLFGIGKKKHSNKNGDNTETPSKPESTLPSPPATSQLSSRRSTTTSGPMETPQIIPSSPIRGQRSVSPRLSSPAGSQIFERDVQEATVVVPHSPAIPSHIQVENHIPPALDATSEAITDDHLDPDSVEIITHASHQPAALTVTGGGQCENASTGSWVDELAALAEKEESASNYGSLDSADVRRLSFISFADVVQAEQGHAPPTGSRASMHLAGLTSLSSAGLNRSPSPVRSPISSQAAETSPPTSNPGSVKGVDMSPSRKPLSSPASSHYGPGVETSGELNIETMSQALRRTGSTDLSNVRSLPISPIEGPSR